MNISDTTTANSATAVYVKGDDEPPKKGAAVIRATVMTADEIVLEPLCELGRTVLAMFGHHTIKSEVMLMGLDAEAKKGWGRTVQRLTLRLELPAMLTRGGDPLFTGRSISREEAEALIEHLAMLRGEATRAPGKRARPKRGR